MAIVEARGVERRYHQGEDVVKALDGVSLDIEAGEFVALAGPSGSGKTTLLNLIGGLDVPDAGSLCVDGHNLGRMNGGELAELRLNRIGFVFQAYNLIPVLTAAENVEYILRLQGVGRVERREKVYAILDEVGLGGKYDRMPADLSGGQQQRVAVARAIVSGPAIVLADEPTANLDSTTGGNLLGMMRQMNRDHGVTFVFSTHDPLVIGSADRVISIRDGRVADDRRK